MGLIICSSLGDRSLVEVGQTLPAYGWFDIPFSALEETPLLLLATAGRVWDVRLVRMGRSDPA